jgi:hypothetical protein
MSSTPTHEFLTDQNGVTWRMYLNADDEIVITNDGTDGWATTSYVDNDGWTEESYVDADNWTVASYDGTDNWTGETYPTQPLWVWKGYGDTIFEDDGGVFEDDGGIFVDDVKQ